jgi:hypothetical protein
LPFFWFFGNSIAAVRAALECELGETVSRRLAARVLGVSHTALDRWIKAGDLPVVYSPKGRVEMPVPALLDLYEAVESRARSLAYHRALAKRLRNPMVDEARHVLFRWRDQGRIDQRYADRWERVLSQPLPEIRQALVDGSQEGDDLRQNSPFAGMLSEPERQRIVREVS